MKFTMKMGSCTIDGKTFSGKTISIVNGKVVVDGVEQEGNLVGDINITVNGDVETLENTSGDVKANNVGSIHTVSGDIECGNVSGSVSTVSGDVECRGKIGGNVNTVSGDITER